MTTVGKSVRWLQLHLYKQLGDNQVEDGRQLISCSIFAKFKMRHCKLYVWA